MAVKLNCIKKLVTFLVCVITQVNVLNEGAIRFYYLSKLGVSGFRVLSEFWSGCLDLGYVWILVTSGFRDSENCLDLETLPVQQRMA